MPVAATGLTDVVAGDPQPLVVGGGGQHALQQLAIAGLQLRLLLQAAAGLGDPVGKRVANRLQLAQPQGPWLARHRRDPGLDPQARESVGEE